MLSLYSVGGGEVCPGAGTAAKGPKPSPSHLANESFPHATLHLPDEQKFPKSQVRLRIQELNSHDKSSAS